jgi:hypothetical protein
VGLVQETYVDPLLPAEVIKFQLPAADTVGVPAGQPQSFFRVGRLGNAAILSYKKDNGFEDSP